MHVNLRPHHLLCTRAFKGKGYSPAFVENMRRIIDCMKAGAEIALIAGADDICAACPERIGNRCRSEAKVAAFDKAVITHFPLERKRYPYTEIENLITVRLTEAVYELICGNCEWQRTGVCCYADVQRMELLSS